jgi:hypothetical protein
MTRYWANKKPPVHPTGEWLRLSHHLTWEGEEIADRDDLIVMIAPNAGFDDTAYENGELILDDEGKPLGEQHPGVTFPADGIIEVNANYLPDGLKPEDMHPEVRKDRENYPVVWGILTHEGAHAHYSKWMEAVNKMAREGKIEQEQQPHIGAAVILEETRIEAKQVDFRPQDQTWLQASGTHLALEEVQRLMKEAQDAGIAVPKVAVARAAALVLARVDAGSVIADDTTNNLWQLTNDTFGPDAPKLQRIWRDAQNVDDYDWKRMIALGKEWYELTGDSGDEGEQLAIAMGDGDGDSEGGQSPLEKMLREAAKNAKDEASGEGERDRRRARISKIVSKRRDEGRAQKEAQEMAKGVFAGKGDNYRNPITGYRDPTPAEMSLARTTRRQLQAAYLPERAITKVTRELPPGRLSVTRVQQLDAQRQAGLLPDAEPFLYKDRTHVPTPPLKVGIIQDVSGSQSSAAAAAASGAWSLAKATTMIADAELAMVSFGDRVNAIFNPRHKLSKVPILQTPYGTDYFLDALKAIEGELMLYRGGSARLVVILTDGYLSHRDLQGRDQALKRLADMGVKFLWMVTDSAGDPDYYPGKITGVHVYKEAAGHWDVVPKMINTEAVRALKK